MSPAANHRSFHSSRSSYSQDEETTCGWGPCRGPGLQKLATKKSYLLVYSFVGLFQAMFFTYSIAVLTTIEKQFKLKSQTTGILLSGNEVSQIMLSLLLTYFGGQGHRPRLVAVGMICSAVASLLATVPHFVYGRDTPVSNSTRNYDLCDINDNEFKTENCDDYGETIAPMIFIFLSQFVSGIGSTLFYTLGITYLDDNAERKQTPILFGIMSSLRLVGPTLGFALAGFCLRLYVNVTENTNLKPSDPAWIGAWWIGYLVISATLLLTSWLLALFPRRLPQKPSFIRATSVSSRTSTSTNRKIKDFPTALKRLLKNKVLMLNNISAVFYVFAFSGYITFLPKYLETQFQLSSAKSNLVNGGTTIFFMASGFLLSGFMISKLRPRAWILASWDVVIGICYVAGLIFFAFYGCNGVPFHTKSTSDNMMDIDVQCNEDCNCLPNRFKPICSEDGLRNFFSPCHAGCSSFNFTSGRKVYTDCSCIGEWQNGTDGSTSWRNANAFDGYCLSDCFQSFLVYILAMGLMKFLSATGRIGSMIIGFRCVDQEDKSFAIGLGTLFVSLFAFIPGPIVYGAIIDQACTLWRTDCGHQGNCFLYDPEIFRNYLHLITAAFVALGVLFDAFLIYFVRNLNLYEEEGLGEKSISQEAKKPMLTTGKKPAFS